jgi:hypothetical protein
MHHGKNQSPGEILVFLTLFSTLNVMDYVKEAYNHYAIEVHGAREVQHAVSII